MEMISNLLNANWYQCPNCDGELKIISAILEAPVIETILTHLGQASACTASGASPWPGAVSGLMLPNRDSSCDPRQGQLEPELQAWALRWQQRSLQVTMHCVAACASTPTEAWDPIGRLWPLLGTQAGTLIWVWRDGHVLACWPALTQLADADPAQPELLDGRRAT